MSSSMASYRGEVTAVGRRPETAGPVNRSKSELLSRFPGPAACALEERRPRHFSSSSRNWTEPAISPTKRKRGRTDVPTARRTVRRSGVTDACIRNGRASHRRQAITDRLSFCRQSSAPTPKLSNRLFAPLRLCVFALKTEGPIYRVRARAPSAFICVICG
jgi:hypothetical protein